MASAHNSQQAAAVHGTTIKGLGMTGAMVERQLGHRRLALANMVQRAILRQPADRDQPLFPLVRAIGRARPRRAAGHRRRYFGGRDHRLFGAAEPRTAADREHHRRLVVAASARAAVDRLSRDARKSRRAADLHALCRTPKGLLEVEEVGVRGRDGRADPVRRELSAPSPGKFLGIIGPSGSGKTTLGKILVGAIQPTVGDGAASTAPG